ncbi:stage V sporulation protein AB [Paenibacillus sp. F411]|uniref:Stage V sporulation protein AB n=1 Tax=Paenibacillus algicola TaxID=2565926 RepID=A0A4P8XIS9_9BACL|nr:MULTISPECIES: stage V sporulation protein AB [Paenibacillus]MBO2945076.1 stage V sporulation protein AB [Paenibacillus sp. F411]QCT02506.1 stage V sporulation protein AB [Paenibacillus algicola]
MLKLHDALSILLGVAGGVAVGGGVIALIIVLDIIPRLAQLTRTYHRVHWYEGALIGGSLIGTLADFWHWSIPLGRITSTLIGLWCGIFIGLLAAALTEVLNVLPILAKRLKMTGYLFGLLMAMVAGKVAGSLFDWFIYRP